VQRCKNSKKYTFSHYILREGSHPFIHPFIATPSTKFAGFVIVAAIENKEAGTYVQ